MRYSSIPTLLICGLLAVASSASADIVKSLDDIPTWVGSGSNRAGLVIDWGDGRSPIAWGYRWEGSAKAEALVRNVDTADIRLVSGITKYSFGSLVDSFGYDRDGDGFSSSDPDDSFGNFDGAQFWELFTAESSPYNGSSTWTSSGVGMSEYALEDGNWVGFRFDDGYPGPEPGPVPASIPEPSVFVLFGGTLLGAAAVGRIRRKTCAQ
jgi:hypothetical protein